MGLIDDILKGLPVNPALREKVAQLDAQKAAAETENAILKDDLRKLKAENAGLKKQIEELSHDDPNLSADEVRILSILADDDAKIDVDAPSLVLFLGLHTERINYALERLIELGFIHPSYMGQENPIYSLAHKGRGYLIRNNLI